MQTLTRYVLIEFIKVLVITLVGMTALIILALIGQQAIREGIGLRPLMKLVPYALPDAMRYAVPGTVLLAVTSVFGRMAAMNEIVAVKSLGISPLMLVGPVLVVAGFLSLGTVWINDLAVSWGREGVQRVLIESVEETAYGILASQKTLSNDKMTISVRKVEGRSLIGPMITIKQGQNQSDLTIAAREARLHANLESGELTIRLFDATVEGDVHTALKAATLPGDSTYVIPLTDLSRRGKNLARPSEMPLRAVQTAVRAQRDNVAEWRREDAVTLAHKMILGDLPPAAVDSWRPAHQASISQAIGTLCRLSAEPHRRWANGFSCLCFAMVGAPMAIRRRHGEFLASFFACFLPILIVYYPFLMISVDHAKEGTWPPQSVWLGNIVLAAWGVWLLRRVLRY